MNSVAFLVLTKATTKYHSGRKLKLFSNNVKTDQQLFKKILKYCDKADEKISVYDMMYDVLYGFKVFYPNLL